MEGLPWIPQSEHQFGNKELVDGYVEISGKDDTSESSNVKRKVEGLFCVMRKRTCRHNSVDDGMFPDLDNAEKGGYIRNCPRPESDFWFENLMDNPYDPLDEGSIVDDCSSDTDISESSEFDVISEHVLEDNDLITASKSLSIWSSEDKGTLVSKWSLETHNSILLLSSDENDVRSKEDEVLSSVSASPKELQHITDPQIFSGHSNDNFLFHSERKQDQMSCIPGHCGDILRCSVSKEDPEIPCNSDIFENDGDKSSAIEVRCGDVVNMQGSMEIMCINDELTLWNKDDEPIPISIVPPDGWSRILPETCSLHQIDICINEYNVHDDHIGLEISPIPLTKTLERPSRPWSVCGSKAAVRNLTLVEDSSGACSSLGEQLYVNVNSSEDRDAELAQTPSTLYQEEVDGEDEIDIDAMIRKLNLVPDDSDSCFNREEWNMSKHPRHALIGLEHCTRTSLQRANMFHGAIAILHCRDSKHFVRKREVIIGRSSDGLNVDIDLGKYNYGSKISRRQALVKLENNGSFSLKNLGKRHILVNGEKIVTGQIATLTSCSSIDIRGITFVYKINKEAVGQFLKNNTQRKTEDNSKFRWCE
ncbi:Forkhead-associated (FHA) domain [Arabidopsis thaliana x Arabidopsis arenosa]|uniref:Forkhead-associated (FHA) domain n=1 Tax=Arabidopsis thaliana x Arabidopsis arenosa TaxID=1240361 RepID=A0A8T2BD18_9BRAS|nr:Forkhead-associated (FHA) domain [Arabidopsis thaliana x Arabidopsis arenosa]